MRDLVSEAARRTEREELWATEFEVVLPCQTTTSGAPQDSADSSTNTAPDSSQLCDSGGASPRDAAEPVPDGTDGGALPMEAAAAELDPNDASGLLTRYAPLPSAVVSSSLRVTHSRGSVHRAQSNLSQVSMQQTISVQQTFSTMSVGSDV